MLLNLTITPSSYSEARTISTGIPLPEGATGITQIGRLRLLGNGSPVNAQFSTRWSWQNGKVRVAGLVFVASPGVTYQVDDDGDPDNPPEDPLLVRQYIDGNNHLIFEAAGNTIDITALAASGPYIDDQLDQRWAAQVNALTVEESGPARVSAVAKGVFTRNAATWHAFETRFFLSASSTTLEIEHTFIFTSDTRGNPPSDIGFILPAGNRVSWSAGLDGQVFNGSLDGYVHQYRWNQARVIEDEVPTSYNKSDGWLISRSATQARTVVLRDVWQKYPKELETTESSIIVHLWPAHGINTFTQQEELSLQNIYKLFYAHHGTLLDVAIRQEYVDVLNQLDAETNWDGDETVTRATTTTSAGLCSTARFGYDIRPAANMNQAAIDSLVSSFMAEPHAAVAPSWLVSSKALESFDVFPVRSAATSILDGRLHDDLPTQVLSWIEDTAEYGMWVYGGTHVDRRDPTTPLDPTDDYAHVHRVWQNSHYSHVTFPLLLYLRSPATDMLQLARLLVAHWLDTGWNQNGEARHTKSFVPWCRQVSYGTHYIDPDSLFLIYLFFGDRRALSMYEKWFTRFSTVTPKPSGARGRESANTLAHVLTYYDYNQHSDALDYIQNRAAVKFNSGPFEEWQNATFVNWHVRWMERLYRLIGEQWIVDRARSFQNVFFEIAGFSVALFLYNRSNDPEDLLKILYKYQRDLNLDIRNAVYWRRFRELLNYADGLVRAGIPELGEALPPRPPFVAKPSPLLTQTKSFATYGGRRINTGITTELGGAAFSLLLNLKVRDAIGGPSSFPLSPQVLFSKRATSQNAFLIRLIRSTNNGNRGRIEYGYFTTASQATPMFVTTQDIPLIVYNREWCTLLISRGEQRLRIWAHDKLVLDSDGVLPANTPITTAPLYVGAGSNGDTPAVAVIAGLGIWYDLELGPDEARALWEAGGGHLCDLNSVPSLPPPNLYTIAGENFLSGTNIQPLIGSTIVQCAGNAPLLENDVPEGYRIQDTLRLKRRRRIRLGSEVWAQFEIVGAQTAVNQRYAHNAQITCYGEDDIILTYHLSGTRRDSASHLAMAQGRFNISGDFEGFAFGGRRWDEDYPTEEVLLDETGYAELRASTERISTDRFVQFIERRQVPFSSNPYGEVLVRHSDVWPPVWSSLRPTVVLGTEFTFDAGSRLIELPNGDLVKPVWWRNVGETRSTAALIRSTDQGITWSFYATIARDLSGPNGRAYRDPQIVELHNGLFLCLIRDDDGANEEASSPGGGTPSILASTSTDLLNWSNPVFAFSGFAPPKLVQHPIHRTIVAVTRQASYPWRNILRTSYDLGRTWAPEIVISEPNSGPGHGGHMVVCHNRILLATSEEQLATTNLVGGLRSRVDICEISPSVYMNRRTRRRQ